MKKLISILVALVLLPGVTLAQTAYVDFHGGNPTIIGADGYELRIGTEDTDNMVFIFDNTSKWTWEGADGDLVPTTDGNVDIGSAANEVDNIYVEDLTVENTVAVTSTVTATGGFITGGNIVSDTDGNDSVGTAAVNFGDAYFGDGTDYVHIDEDVIDSTVAAWKIFSSSGTNAGLVTIGIESTADATTGAFVSIAGVGHASVGDLILSTGDDAGGDLTLTLAANDSALDVKDDGGQRLFQISQAGVWGSDAAITDLGLEYVTGADTACTTTCVAADGACLIAVQLAAGATAPVLTECDDATADACVCLERAA